MLFFKMNKSINFVLLIYSIRIRLEDKLESRIYYYLSLRYLLNYILEQCQKQDLQEKIFIRVF